MSDRDWPIELDEQIAAVARSENPYEASLAVTASASDAMALSVTASRLYLLWADLQDGWELGILDEAAMFKRMRDAALGWSAAKDNAQARTAYLNRWQYRILGHEDPRFGRRTSSRIRRKMRALRRRRAESREAVEPSPSIPEEISFPVQSRKLDLRLAFVRQEARRIVTRQYADDVAVFNAAQRIWATLQTTRWTQKRYPHFQLTDEELGAIQRAVAGWRSSSASNVAEIREVAEALGMLGEMPRPLLL